MASYLVFLYLVGHLILDLRFAASLEKVYFGKKIVDSELSGSKTFETISDISVKGCINNCKTRKLCAFVNYYIRIRVCYLIQHANPTVQASIEQKVGFLYGRKSQWSMIGYEVCETCEHETCTITNGWAQCHVTGCSPPVLDPNVVVSGNMYTIGSQLQLRCANGTVSTGPTSPSASIVCEETGLWAGNTISCIPYSFICPDAMNEFQTVPLEDGTDITFRMYTEKEKYDDLLSLCAQHNASLLQILTVVKLGFTRELLKCPGFTNDIYIDGKYNVNNGVWETSDSHPLPTADIFWVEGQIYGTTNDDRCVGVETDDGLFRNKKCTNRRAYICEKP